MCRAPQALGGLDAVGSEFRQAGHSTAQAARVASVAFRTYRAFQEERRAEAAAAASVKRAQTGGEATGQAKATKATGDGLQQEKHVDGAGGGGEQAASPPESFAAFAASFLPGSKGWAGAGREGEPPCDDPDTIAGGNVGGTLSSEESWQPHASRKVSGANEAGSGISQDGYAQNSSADPVGEGARPAPAHSTGENRTSSANGVAHSPMPPPPPPHLLFRRVELRGLLGATSLNGRRGVATAYNADTNR